MVDTLYADVSDLRAYLSIQDSADDAALIRSITSASRWIDKELGRRFYVDDLAAGPVADPALARFYEGAGVVDLYIDDYDPATAITVEFGTGLGTYPTTLTAGTDYLALPLNIEPGYPRNLLRRIGDVWYCSTYQGTPTVKVTARWGWPSVPDDIATACLIRAADIFKQKDAPFGVAGFGDFGAVRTRANAEVNALIGPFSRRIKTLIA